MVLFPEKASSYFSRAARWQDPARAASRAAPANRQPASVRNRKMTIDRQALRNHVSYGALVLLCTAAFAGTALAGEKPPVVPDQPSALTTPSRVSATIEFGLPSIASAVERDVPRRLATIDERIGCVNKRVFVFRIRANCDVDGFVDRGAMSVYGSGDHLVGSVPIFGTIE